ncbi:putative transmembrane protein [Mesorhizobium alhagi CCNWXJ12-2]|uniref:Putative transmembrane protein n=2 Tax=Allomesorhizobium alhagi TaxID=475067 RepID=H0I3U1_9HYPH|nr:putative transmembrane protein [Mesorhizobium alhagi CCNWXJ12-2]
MVSLGILGAIDTYVTATIIPVPVWVTFIAWASFFACGGGKQGLIKSIVSNWTGILIATITLIIIQFGPAHPIFAAILVGLGTSAMILVSGMKILDFPPAIVFGFASLVGTTAAMNTSIITADLNHPTLVAMAAMLLGGIFGLLSEMGTALLSSKKPVAA